eukprot:131382-Prorocentrum_minimum.AAC.1
MVPRLRAPESTVVRPMAVYRQGIYVKYSVEYSKCCALNGLLVSTVDSGACPPASPMLPAPLL